MSTVNDWSGFDLEMDKRATELAFRQWKSAYVSAPINSNVAPYIPPLWDTQTVSAVVPKPRRVVWTKRQHPLWELMRRLRRGGATVRVLAQGQVRPRLRMNGLCLEIITKRKGQ